MLVAMLVAAYNTMVVRNALFIRWCLPVLSFPLDSINIMSFALSLLLVFRTNASYTRWCEGRRAWGIILDKSRDLIRYKGEGKDGVWSRNRIGIECRVGIGIGMGSDVRTIKIGSRMGTGSGVGSEPGSGPELESEVGL